MIRGYVVVQRPSGLGSAGSPFEIDESMSASEVAERFLIPAYLAALEWARTADVQRAAELEKQARTSDRKDIVELGSRQLRICRTPDGAIIRDSKKRIAVRNVTTNRLSYVPELLLLAAVRKAKRAALRSRE